MRRLMVVSGAVVLVAAMAGCASGKKQGVASPAKAQRLAAVDPAGAVKVSYREVGVTLAEIPAGYRAPLSRAEVLSRLRRTNHGPISKDKPTAHLWTVREPGSALGYQAWVVTFHHTRPTAVGVPSSPSCSVVSIYNLRSRVWTWHFQLCPDRMPSRPNCDYGCTPANEPALDAAVSAAQKLAGPAYYSGAAVNIASNKVTVWLAHAPQPILARLDATHRGRYVIHNNAPRTLRAVKNLMHSFNPKALKDQGITVSEYGPTQDGYLQVGVTSHVAQAQAKLNAVYGPDTIQVVEQALAVAAVGHFG